MHRRLLTFELHFHKGRERERGHPIPHVKPDRIKTVVIFCDKGRYVPILENSTGTDLGNGSKTEVCLGRDLFTSLESVRNPFAEFILLWVSHITVLSKLQRHLQKAICAPVEFD